MPLPHRCWSRGASGRALKTGLRGCGLRTGLTAAVLNTGFPDSPLDQHPLGLKISDDAHTQFDQLLRGDNSRPRTSAQHLHSPELGRDRALLF